MDLITESLHPSRDELLSKNAEFLLDAYHESHRHYHDIGHIWNLLNYLQQMKEFMDLGTLMTDQLQRVIWYHDVVYSAEPVQYGDNEDKSADIMTSHILAMDKPRHEAKLTVREDEEVNAIRGTADHTWPRSLVAALFYDLDLASLGTHNDVYVLDNQKIRREYKHVDGNMWKIGRSEFIAKMLKRTTLYQTSWGAQREAQARYNLEHELEYLNS